MTKTIIIITTILFTSFIAISGKDSKNIQLRELQNFANNKDKVYHLLDEKEGRLFIIYKNRISATISYNYENSEEYVFNELNITYVINGKDIASKLNSQKEVLDFVKVEIDKNDFLIQTFFDEEFQNAYLGIDKPLGKSPGCLYYYTLESHIHGELFIKIIPMSKEQIIVSIHYALSL
ncbi:MAG TPA: hypothetical protein PLK02_05315 [Paludibacteraceae bacterium]|nr:hypothetical protein [Paludibacteraceae bacterium]HPL94501.1 hypothetical protein [Paludibacteraceae bacterium]